MLTAPAPLSPEERSRLRAAFAASLSTLIECEVYWVEPGRRLVFRSSAAKRRFSLPPDALPVGHYSWPFPSRNFLEDLDCALHRLSARLASVEP
jgi:hypothetical protein